MKINVWNEQIQLENPELVIGRIAKPVILEIWNGRQKDSVIQGISLHKNYTDRGWIKGMYRNRR